MSQQDQSATLSWKSVSLDDLILPFRDKRLEAVHFVGSALPSWRSVDDTRLLRWCNFLGFDGAIEQNRKWLYDQLQKNSRGISDFILTSGQENAWPTSPPSNVEEVSDVDCEAELSATGPVFTITTETDCVLDNEGQIKQHWQNEIIPGFSNVAFIVAFSAWKIENY